MVESKIARLSSHGMASGYALAYNAHPPVTWGVAIEVPYIEP